MMDIQTESYQSEIVVSVNLDIAFNAITKGVDKWWGEVSNSVDKLGDTFTKLFGETYWTFRVTKITSNSAIDMICIYAHHVVDGFGDSIRKEWLDTTLRWRLEETAEGTKITLTHDGLVNDLACYDICVSGWDHFFVGELKNYLDDVAKD